jgi:hypothetical protein
MFILSFQNSLDKKKKIFATEAIIRHFVDESACVLLKEAKVSRIEQNLQSTYDPQHGCNKWCGSKARA